MHIFDRLMYSTILIECILHDGTTSSGTGFFLTLDEDGEGNVMTVLVTNKHVVENAAVGTLKIICADKDEMPIHNSPKSYEIDDFESKWIMHPEDEVDLCVLPLATFLDDKAMLEEGITHFIQTVDESFFINDEEYNALKAVEDIIMIGYPNGLRDDVNNKPIIRKGITATHPAIDYEGNKDFLIDMPSFEGSSGSPVFLIDKILVLNGNSLGIETKVKFLGILHSGFERTTEGRLEKVPIKNITIPVFEQHLDIGIVVKAEKVWEFKEILKA